MRPSACRRGISSWRRRGKGRDERSPDENTLLSGRPRFLLFAYLQCCRALAVPESRRISLSTLLSTRSDAQQSTPADRPLVSLYQSMQLIRCPQKQNIEKEHNKEQLLRQQAQQQQELQTVQKRRSKSARAHDH